MTLAIELSAVVVTVKDGTAMVLCRPGAEGACYALPSGPFAPGKHRTFDLALRAFVHDQTGFDIGYVEQLYSFGDAARGDVISVGYLALTPSMDFETRSSAVWVPFHRFFPWEDFLHGHRDGQRDGHRDGEQNASIKALRPALDHWAGATDSPAEAGLRLRRIETLFPLEFDHWNEERVLDRYELLYDAGLVGEAGYADQAGVAGVAMALDHRRILATGLSRLRGKLKYRPVAFELTPPEFTLSELQRTVEAVAGVSLHKQNFRRGLERTDLVEGLGRLHAETGGRPAELFRFRRDLVRAGPAPGLPLPMLRD